MKQILIFHLVLNLIAADSLINIDELHRIEYAPEVNDLDTSKDASNIIEVRVLPDPGFIPPPYIKFDRKGLLEQKSLQKVSRTVSRISTRVAVSSNKEPEHDSVNEAQKFSHFKQLDIDGIGVSLEGANEPRKEILETFTDNREQNKISPTLQFSEFKEAYSKIKNNYTTTTITPFFPKKDEFDKNTLDELTNYLKNSSYIQDITSTHRPFITNISTDEPKKTSTSKFVIKSVTNALPDEVIMEKPVHVHNTHSNHTENSVHKTMSTIVNVKRVFTGANKNSTVYRITKRRRKKTTKSPKQPKSLPKFTSSNDNSDIHKASSFQISTKPKPSLMTKDVGHGGIKRIRKKRLKGSRKKETAKEKHIQPPSNFTETERETSSDLETNNNQAKTKTAGKFRRNKFKVKSRTGKTTTPKPLDWDGDIDISDRLEEFIPTPQPLISLNSYNALPQLLIKNNHKASSSSVERLPKLILGDDKTHKENKIMRNKARNNEKFQKEIETTRAIDEDNQGVIQQVNKKNRGGYKNKNETVNKSSVQPMGDKHTKKRQTPPIFVNKINETKKRPVVRLISRRRKTAKLSVDQEVLNQNNTTSDSISTTHEPKPMIRKIVIEVDEVRKQNSKRTNNDKENNTLVNKHSSMIKGLKKTPDEGLANIAKRRKYPKKKEKIQQPSSDRTLNKYNNSKKEFSTYINTKRDKLKNVDWTDHVKTEIEVMKKNDDVDRIDHSVLDKKGDSFKDVYDYYANVDEERKEGIDMDRRKEETKQRRNPSSSNVEIIPNPDRVFMTKKLIDIATTTGFIPTPLYSTSLSPSVAFESKKIATTLSSPPLLTTLLTSDEKQLKPPTASKLISKKKESYFKANTSRHGLKSKFKNIESDKVSRRKSIPTKKINDFIRKNPPTILNNFYSSHAEILKTDARKIQPNTTTVGSYRNTAKPKELHPQFNRYPTSKDIPGHSKMFEEQESTGLEVDKNKIKANTLIKNNILPEISTTETTVRVSSTTRKDYPPLTATITTPPNFSSPPADGKWYPIILPKTEHYGLTQPLNQHRKRQMIQEHLAKDEHTNHAYKHSELDEVYMSEEEKGKTFQYNGLSRPTKAATGDNRDLHFREVGLNQGRSKQNTLPQNYFGHKATATPRSTAHIKYGLPFGVSNTKASTKVNADTYDKKPLDSDTIYNSPVISNNSSFKHIDIPKIPSFKHFEEFDDFEVSVYNTAKPGFDEDFSSHVHLQEVAKNSVYNTPEPKIVLEQPNEIIDTDTPPVPILTPTTYSAQPASNRLSTEPYVSIKREVIQNTNRPPIFREYFDKISTEINTPFYEVNAMDNYQQTTRPTYKHTHQHAEPRLFHHKQGHGRALGTNHPPHSFRDDSVDFGAATGNSGAFGWYSDHVVGFGENDLWG